MPRDSSLGLLRTPDNPNIRLKDFLAVGLTPLRFSGSASDRSVSDHTAEFERQLRERKLTPVGPVAIAGYDPPWTLPFFRRTESLILIEK
jgi:SOUL heme-binding protein